MVLPLREPAAKYRSFIRQPASRLALIEDGPQDVDRTVAAARQAFNMSVWPELSVEKRVELLEACERIILDNIDELARLECLATGLVMTQIKGFHLPRAAYNFRFFAQYISQARGERYDNTDGYMSTVKREPAGVVALIAPWNAPLALATMKIAAALAFAVRARRQVDQSRRLGLVRPLLFYDHVRRVGLVPVLRGLV